MITSINRYRLLVETLDTDIEVMLNGVKRDPLLGWKDVNVNSIFKHKYVQKYRNKWKSMEEKYYKNGGRRNHGGEFSKTGLTTTTVNLNDIYPGQVGVEYDSLVKLLSNKTDLDHKHSSEKPVAIMLYYVAAVPIMLLIDGHHRVAAAILREDKTMEIDLKTQHFV